MTNAHRIHEGLEPDLTPPKDGVGDFFFEPAEKEAVIKAHKRLIQKLHPDRGGNDYLAAKVNAARDKLIG